MLGMLKSFFARPSQLPPIDAVFHPRFRESFHLGAQAIEGAISFGATGSAAWFDPNSEADRRLLMGEHTHLLETDSPQMLSDVAQKKYAPHNGCVLYQPWREPSFKSNIRPLGALTEAMAPAIGEALCGSPVKHFFLITGGIFPGALSALKDALKGHRLETLGLFWYYSGDDMTDEPTVTNDLLALCQACKVEKLSLLTAAIDSVVEKRLADGLATAPLLTECSIFEKDDNGRYPRFRTPIIDAALRARDATPS